MILRMMVMIDDVVWCVYIPPSNIWDCPLDIILFFGGKKIV